MINAIKLNTAITDMQVWFTENLARELSRQDTAKINKAFADLRRLVGSVPLDSQVKTLDHFLDDLERLED